MLAVAKNFIVNKDLRTYYGVGSPSPMPFEYNIEKHNLTEGYILKAFVCWDTASTIRQKRPWRKQERYVPTISEYLRLTESVGNNRKVPVTSGDFSIQSAEQMIIS